MGSDINSSTANQYQFGSTETAQLYKVTIPEDWNTDSKYLISGGAISMSGFGDAYGSHRLVSPTTGRYANFTASQSAALLGTFPIISVDVQSTQHYNLIFKVFRENVRP